MERRLDQDLDRVRQALLDRNNQLANEVIGGDRDVDHLEIEIDEACHLILGTKQPTAVDLRFLVAVMKINSDLERIGDSAVNIAQSV
ncbi:MAG TPA: PhoU domain-containing protein, partial [Thermoanaerobaculia bacterium]